MMDDFNADNATLDAALKANANAITAETTARIAGDMLVKLKENTVTSETTQLSIDMSDIDLNLYEKIIKPAEIRVEENRKTRKPNIDARAARNADARDQWTRLDTGKENKKSKRKTEYGYKRAARAKSEAIGRQALAERAASEAKFVLIAERKTQEEA